MPVVTRSFPPPLTATRWTVDPSASTVEFGVRQLWGLSTVRGRFTRFDGELQLGEDGMGRAELCIEAASVETGNRRRDRHLRSADYFDCERHPLVRYAGAAVAGRGGRLEVTGRLEAAGKGVPLTLVATAEGSDDRLELAAAAGLDARELGMTWAPVGNPRTPVELAVRACLRRAP